MFQLSSFSVNNSMQHFLDAVPFPSLISEMPFSYFLPLKIFSQLLIFSNSCCCQRGTSFLLIVETSVRVDAGSQDDSRIGEASVGSRLCVWRAGLPREAVLVAYGAVANLVWSYGEPSCDIAVEGLWASHVIMDTLYISVHLATV